MSTTWTFPQPPYAIVYYLVHSAFVRPTIPASNNDDDANDAMDVDSPPLPLPHFDTPKGDTVDNDGDVLMKTCDEDVIMADA